MEIQFKGTSHESRRVTDYARDIEVKLEVGYSESNVSHSSMDVCVFLLFRRRPVSKDRLITLGRLSPSVFLRCYLSRLRH